MKKAFIVVGHACWGKSKTFYYLTNKSSHKLFISIGDKMFTVKRMSNDDIGNKLLDYIKEMTNESREYLLFALCPDFKNEAKCTEEILENLRNNEYKQYFFVLYKQYGNEAFIKKEEIDKLSRFGKVCNYKESELATERAKALEQYIKDNV